MVCSLVRGAADGLLLSVMPVMTARRVFAGKNTLAVALIALLASLIAAAAYHAGYPELRNASLLSPVIGNGSITLSYLLGRNPLAPILAHVAMHVAAVFHGPEGVMQLPPHC